MVFTGTGIDKGSIIAHFAKLNSSNIVERIEVVHNNVATDETAGINFLKSLYGNDTNWKQTSYNTDSNSHKLGGTPFRKNYARKSFIYDETRDAFAPKLIILLTTFAAPPNLFSVSFTLNIGTGASGDILSMDPK